MYDPSMEVKESENQYLLSTPQMMELFKDIPESIYNVGDLVDKINFDDFKDRLGVSKLPKFPIPEEPTKSTW